MDLIKEILTRIAEQLKNLFGDLFDQGKQTLNDKYFGTVKCLHCGVTGNVRTMAKTEDVEYICDNCRCKLPENFRRYTDMNSSADVKAAAEYVDHARRTLHDQFMETFSYEYLLVDDVHGLIRVGGICYDMKNIKSFRFSYKPLDAKNGLFNAKVQGDVILVLNTVSPALHIEEVMARDVQAKAKLDHSTDTYYYEYPPTLDAFFRDMESAVKRFKEASEY